MIGVMESSSLASTAAFLKQYYFNQNLYVTEGNVINFLQQHEIDDRPKQVDLVLHKMLPFKQDADTITVSLLCSEVEC